jgi:ATP-dependent DNA helicase RecG
VSRSLAELARIRLRDTKIRRLTPKQAEALAAAGVETVADLLLHVPRRYIDRTRVEPISVLAAGDEATVVGRVRSISTRRLRGRRSLVTASVSDGTGAIDVTWFNQPYRERQLPPGTEVALFGRLESFRGRPQLTNPVTEAIRGDLVKTGRVVPIYPTVAGIPSWRVQQWMDQALPHARPLLDPVPAEIVERAGLLDRDRAIGLVHAPEAPEDAIPARHRLVFDELFRLEVALALSKRHQIATSRGVAHHLDGPLVEAFIGGLPFPLTDAQRRVLTEIGRDLAAGHPMHRLLQGEVGSGKTVVAVATLLAGVQGGWQGAVMAPTEVLAVQHYLGVATLLHDAGLAPEPVGEGGRLGMGSLFGDGRRSVRIALLTGSQVAANFDPAIGRGELVEAVAAGVVDLVVGTHALIQEGVHFARLGVAVIDEQHRFGALQRVTLKEKGGDVDPDLLIMTATPIPRTLSMTLYGDLDVSVIDEMPPGREPVRTLHLPRAAEAEAWELVRGEVARGRQAFVVCPLVEESPKVEAASATAEHERLTRVFPDLRLGLLHGQLRPGEKEQVMSAFRDGDVDVLVATTVIEVGIDVPNATVVVIEDADRFGLSQLHQIRGRVGRGEHPGRCVLLADPSTPEGEQRIAAMVATTDGFRLAEEDLRIRGQGTVFGSRQSGMADLKLADILADFDTLVEARREAFALIDDDPELEAHPELKEEVRVLLGDAVEWLFVS